MQIFCMSIKHYKFKIIFFSKFWLKFADGVSFQFFAFSNSLAFWRAKQKQYLVFYRFCYVPCFLILAPWNKTILMLYLMTFNREIMHKSSVSHALKQWFSTGMQRHPWVPWKSSRGSANFGIITIKLQLGVPSNCSTTKEVCCK